MFRSQILTILLLFVAGILAKKIIVNQEATIECHRREFTFRATQTDENGRQCWDLVTAMSCWGRCDSGEIGDWRFPFKRPFHPVCVHEKRIPRNTLLRNCDPDADLRIAEYEYYEALSCSCYLCDSSSTSCQGIPSFEQHQRKDIFSAPVTMPGRIIPTDTLDYP